jgi:uncharacterized membrane protein
MAGVASLGVLETAYLTINKLVGRTADLCGTDGSCASVLTGPYSNVPFTDVPLSAIGCAAYSLVVLLAIFPVSLDDPEDSNSRIVLLCLTTAMATFSAFLMSLLVGVLHEWCPFCFASACLSWVLAASAWLGGCLPSEPYVLRKSGVQAAAASSAATTLAAIVLFFSVPEDAMMAGSGSSYSPATPNNNQQQQEQTLLASSTGSTTKPLEQHELSPPPITTTSSERAMSLSKDLQVLNAKMYGAYWCSHCYDQKQTFGKEAFQLIDYVECSKEGKNSNTPLCREKNVPGYPTWEISGKLFPGERALEELEEIVSESGALVVKDKQTTVD